MTTHFHAVVWIDHHEARVIHFNGSVGEEEVVHPAHPVCHLHSKAGSPTGARAAEDPACYRDVAEALANAHTFLVTGPANAKDELVKYPERPPPEPLPPLPRIPPLHPPTD